MPALNAAALFAGLLACAAGAPEKARECIRPFLHSEVSKHLRASYAEWLYAGYRIGKPGACPAKDEAALRTLKEYPATDTVLCFSIARKHADQGFLVFRDEGGGPKLFRVIFSNAKLD